MVLLLIKNKNKLGVAFFTEMSRTDRIPTDPIPKSSENSVSRKIGTGYRPEKSKSDRDRYAKINQSGIPDRPNICIIYDFSNLSSLFLSFCHTHSLFSIFLCFLLLFDPLSLSFFLTHATITTQH